MQFKLSIEDNRMTAVTRTQALLQALTNNTLTNTKMLEIVDKYLWDEISGPSVLANEEKAQLFLDRVRYQLTQEIKHKIRTQTEASNVASMEVAVEASVVDLIQVV